MRTGFETYASFYKSHTDMMQALFLVVDTLRDFQDPESQVSQVIPRHKDGLCSIDDLCGYVIESNPRLSYMKRDHIIELYFKDRERRILIVDEIYVQFRSISYVQPPETLYFGTVKNLVPRMESSGLKSRTKGFIKLYDTPEKACEFAKQFATRDGDVIVSVKINAGAAFGEGTKFSTHNDGEYIVVKVDKRHIQEATEFNGEPVKIIRPSDENTI
jgi:hypothetical protein